MAPEIIENNIRDVLEQLDNKYPASFKNIRRNCMTYRGIPLWPKLILPEIVPFLFKRDGNSIEKCIRIYSGLDDIANLEEHKNSDTLAILGSGSSINELDDSDFAYISSIDSIGLNWWGVYHDFVPDFYKFELGSHIKNIWINRMNKKATNYEETIFIYEPERMFNEGENAAETILELDERLRKGMIDMRIIQYHRHVSNPFRKQTIRELFPTFLRNRVLHFRGSLSQTIALSYFLDYDNIILFGVDLDHSGYFFSDHPNSHKTTDQGKDEEEKHSTAKAEELKGIHEYITYLNKEFFEPEGRSMYIGSRQSLLYPDLNFYEEVK